MCTVSGPDYDAPPQTLPAPAPSEAATEVLEAGSIPGDDGQTPPMTAGLYASLLSRLRVPLSGDALNPDVARYSAPTAPTTGDINQPDPFFTGVTTGRTPGGGPDQWLLGRVYLPGSTSDPLGGGPF